MGGKGFWCDERAVCALQKRIASWALRQVPAQEVDDVVQETLLKMVKYMGDRPALEGSDCERYARPVLSDRCADVHRSACHRPQNRQFGSQEAPVSAASASSQALPDQTLLLRELEGWLGTSPDRNLWALHLLSFGGMTYEELAQHLNITEATARQRVCRGRSRARAYAVYRSTNTDQDP